MGRMGRSMTTTKQSNDAIESIKTKALKKFHNDHTDGDIAIQEMAESFEKLLLEARIDEREGMSFYDDSGEETFKPYVEYRYTGDGLKLSWDDRTAELQSLLNKTGESE